MNRGPSPRSSQVVQNDENSPPRIVLRRKDDSYASDGKPTTMEQYGRVVHHTSQGRQEAETPDVAEKNSTSQRMVVNRQFHRQSYPPSYGVYRQMTHSVNEQMGAQRSLSYPVGCSNVSSELRDIGGEYDASSSDIDEGNDKLRSRKKIKMDANNAKTFGAGKLFTN